MLIKGIITYSVEQNYDNDFIGMYLNSGSFYIMIYLIYSITK
eukprot:Gb_20777 [translate_table: standard]